MSAWETLSKIDCSEYVERKGNLTYLSWAWAWGITKKNFPDANYEMLQHETFPDGTVMVRCNVTIADITHQMWLPVMNHRNQAVANPDAFAINTAMMRCLTKCLAMFGLGHYIYAGEDVPEANDSDLFEDLCKMLDNKDPFAFFEFNDALSDKERNAAFNSAPPTKKTHYKDEWRKRQSESIVILNETIEAIKTAIETDDCIMFEENVDGMGARTKKRLWASLDAVERKKAEQFAAEIKKREEDEL